jgi:tellurite resistance protein TerC
VPEQVALWVAFAVIVTAALFIDLGVLNRRAHVVPIREAAVWCAAWVTLAALFGFGILWRMGAQKSMEFFTGYILEYSLSVDNMFVFIVIFDYFAVPRQYQPRVLHWGILGAMVMRFLFIFIGVSLIHAFHWIIYVFGAMLVYTGLKLMFQKGERVEPDKNPLLGLFRRFMPISTHYHGDRFFGREGALWHATPLLAAVLVVEASDIVFAIDSIPAVLAITTDPFIVYTSNIFAVMGLRSLFFLLAGVMGLFRYLKAGISAILVFVGVKMLLSGAWKPPVWVSLAVIVGVLTLAVLASVAVKENNAGAPGSPEDR